MRPQTCQSLCTELGIIAPAQAPASPALAIFLAPGSAALCRTHSAALGTTQLNGWAYCRAPTARAMTSSEVSSAAVPSMPMSTLARLVSGMVSVGLNALLLVVDR